MKTIACIATIPSRKKQLLKTVESLKSQVDMIFICFNGYDIDLSELPDNVITVKMSGEMGDAGKFYLFAINNTLENKIADVWFFCDDDLIYPEDYIERSLEHLELYPNHILSYHGRTIQKRPIESYYRYSRISSYRCLGKVDDYKHIGTDGTLGTGVMFFKNLELKWNWFKYANMADIYLSKFAIEQGRKMTVCPHEDSWIKQQEVEAGIFEKYYSADQTQTDLYNSI